MTSDVRINTDIPIILFSYYNPIFVYGAAKFGEDAILAGADGVLVGNSHPVCFNGCLGGRETNLSFDCFSLSRYSAQIAATLKLNFFACSRLIL